LASAVMSPVGRVPQTTTDPSASACATKASLVPVNCAHNVVAVVELEVLVVGVMDEELVVVELLVVEVVTTGVEEVELVVTEDELVVVDDVLTDIA
jgi:hypothetical protein